MSKDVKVWGVRQSLLGDCLGALPVLNTVERMYPGSFKYWQIARKCAHVAPLFIDHPLIDKIVISDCDEGMGPRDMEIALSCQVRINTMPSHPKEHDWPNYRDFYSEVYIMSGLTEASYLALPPVERLPKLARWFRPESRPSSSGKIVALWPQAGYGREPKRSPGQVWYQGLINRLIAAGYDIVQYGHPADFTFEGTARRTHIDFFQQVRETLSCDLVISTDSGSGLIFAAYEMPQISLIGVHWPDHTRNLDALAPKNRNGHIFVDPLGADFISTDAVFNRIAEICP